MHGIFELWLTVAYNDYLLYSSEDHDSDLLATPYLHGAL